MQLVSARNGLEFARYVGLFPDVIKQQALILQKSRNKIEHFYHSSVRIILLKMSWNILSLAS